MTYTFTTWKKEKYLYISFYLAQILFVSQPRLGDQKVTLLGHLQENWLT